MKKVATVMLGLFLALVFVPQAVPNPEDSTYDPMADVNRDGTIDANDLQRLGKAYGSTGLVHQPGKTVISVRNETSPKGNARVAIVGNPWAPWPSYPEVLHVGYTNQSGISSFTLGPNTEYVSLAWSGSRYSYAHFTTDSYGQASTSIVLDAGRQHLPHSWLPFMIINATSGEYAGDNMLFLISYTFDSASEKLVWSGEYSAYLYNEIGLCISVYGQYIVGISIAALVQSSSYGYIGDGYFTPDENGSAFVVIYV